MQKGFISTSERDKALFVEQGAAEAVRTTQAQVASAEAQVANAARSSSSAKRRWPARATICRRPSITAPVDGVVISRQVEPGQTVAASLNTPTLFTIAQDLSQMQVDVAIDESDIGRIRADQRVTFTVDAFPGRTFEGNVRQIRKAAQTVQNVVTYIVVVGTRNPALTLVPGMTANVRIVDRPAQQRAQGAERGAALAPGRTLAARDDAPPAAATEGGRGGAAGAAPAPGRRAEARRGAGRARWTRSSTRCAPAWPSFATFRRPTAGSAASDCAPTCGRRSTRC